MNPFVKKTISRTIPEVCQELCIRWKESHKEKATDPSGEECFHNFLLYLTSDFLRNKAVNP